MFVCTVNVYVYVNANVFVYVYAWGKHWILKPESGFRVGDLQDRTKTFSQACEIHFETMVPAVAFFKGGKSETYCLQTWGSCP